MADRKRKVVWKDALIAVSTIAANTINNDVLLAEADVENLGDVTLTRIVGSLQCSFAAGATNAIRGVIWVAPTFTGVGNPTALDTTFYERSRVMWTWDDMVDVADETRRIQFDIRTQRKLSSGVQVELLIHNLGGNVMTYNFHIRSLLKLS